MTCLSIKNSKNLIDCIQSIDDVFYCKNKDELIILLESIGFVEIENDTIYEKKFALFFFEGFIDTQPVELEFYQEINQSECFLTEKHFFKMIDGEKTKHRDNDLPSTLIYNRYENHSILMLKYHENGYASRSNNLQAPFIFFDNNDVTHIYKQPNKSEINDEIIRVKSITCKNNIVIEIEVYYRDEELSLKDLATTIPRIEQFSFEQLANLRDEITPEEYIVLDMQSI
jgi:hypothetical protein